MFENLNNIFIFKTNITSEMDIILVKDLLEANELILEWNVDVEDIDKVLRIVSIGIEKKQIIDIINEKGFVCSELL